MKNQAIKNECFSEVDYDSLTDEMKNNALLLFMAIKRSSELKSRGVAHDRYQRGQITKEDYSSPMPTFYTFKCMYTLIAKEGRDIATIDLPGFFLQTEIEEL